MNCTEYNFEELISYQREIRRLRSAVHELQEEVDRQKAESQDMRSRVCELREKFNRFKTVAHNAMVEGQIEERLSHCDVLIELGISEEEYQSIVG